MTVTSEIEFKPEDEVGGEPAVEIRQWIVGLQAVDDVAVGERGQAVEFHVAVSVGATDEIVAAAGGVDQRAGGELQRVGQVAAGIGKIFKRRGIQRGGGVGVFRIDERGLAGHLDGLLGVGELEDEIDGLLLAQAGDDVLILLRLETWRLPLGRSRCRV